MAKLFAARVGRLSVSGDQVSPDHRSSGRWCRRISPVKRRPRNECQNPESRPPIGVPDDCSGLSPAIYFSPAIQSRQRLLNRIDATPPPISRKRAVASLRLSSPCPHLL